MTSGSSLKSAALLEQMKGHLAGGAGEELKTKVPFVYQINIAPQVGRRFYEIIRTFFARTGYLSERVCGVLQTSNIIFAVVQVYHRCSMPDSRWPTINYSPTLFLACPVPVAETRPKTH